MTLPAYTRTREVDVLPLGSGPMYLSMILGTNFSSESGPEIPLTVSLLIRFGGHVTTKKKPPGFLLTKKGATSLPIRRILVRLAPTESPKRFPNRAFPRLCRVSPTVCCLSNVCRSPHRVPDSRCGILAQDPAESRPCRGGGVRGDGASHGTLVLALTGGVHLGVPHGRHPSI